MKRVLHVIDSLTCGSGMMSFIMNYYRNIDRKKIQFDFLYYKDAKISFKDEIESLGGTCYKIPKPSLAPSFYKEVSKFLCDNSNRYCAIHCHPIFTSLYIGLFKKKYNIKHIIQHSHTSKLSSHFTGIIRNRIILDLAGKYITEYAGCSNEALDLIKRSERNKKETIIINNIIDYDKYKYNLKNRNKIRKEYKISDDCILMGHVGRFSKEKNHDLLIGIFNEYHKKVPNSKLILVGDGPLFQKIKNKISDYNLEESVIITGRVTNPEIYYSSMDLFVFTSNFEGFGLAVVEAQVNGLMVFASKNVPKYTNISNNIFYIDDQNAIDYVNKININYHNYDRNNVVIEDNFDLKCNVKKLEDFYNKF